MPPSDVTSTTIKHPGNLVFAMLCICVFFFFTEFIIFFVVIYLFVFLSRTMSAEELQQKSQTCYLNVA